MPKIMNNTGMIREKYPNAPRTNIPDMTTPIIPSQLDVVKFDDWFSFLKSSVMLSDSRRVSSAAEYDTMLSTISTLNIMRKKPRICFLFEIGNPSSNFLDEPAELPLLSLLAGLFLSLILLIVC
jgi:hypothetical protein